MQEMCSEFKNIILLLPSKDKDKSRRILSERRNIKLGSNKDKGNWHFLTAPNNYELATKIVYEEGKTPEDISREIIQLVKGEVKSKETDEREETQMKISGIDKDFEDIIYYLDAKGYKPFASCDGVEANHERPKEVTDAYISFLKSPKIIDLMAVFLQDKENYTVSLNSGDNERATELYGNIILGMRYGVYFNNKSGENSDKFNIAFEIGKALIDNGYRIQTGGLGGVMRAACYGAKSSEKYKEGDIIALVPSFDINEVNEFADIVIPTGLDVMRNALVANASAVVAIGGGAGTLSEMAFAWTFG